MGFFNPSFFLNCPEFFHAGKKEQRLCQWLFHCRLQKTTFFFFNSGDSLCHWERCKLQEWYNIQDRVIISYAGEAPG